MDKQNNAYNNERTNLKLVLEELTNEQKSQTKSLNELISAVNSLSNIVVNFKEEVQKPDPISDSTDTLSVQEIVRKGVTDIKLIVATQQQKPILNRYQLLLFPEQDTRLFYKIVFSRWFLWLTIMLFLTNLYKFSVHYSDSHREIQLQILKNDRIKRSWDRLYFKSDRRFKKIMDSTYSQSAGSIN
jgi:hypothetical protein